MTLVKRFPLNAKAIKKALKIEGVKVYSCKRGAGSTKNATYIHVCVNDRIKAIDFLKNIGVIDCLGKPLKEVGFTNRTEGPYDLGACYMDEETHNELKEY